MANKIVSEEVLASRRAVCTACSSKKDMSDNPLFVVMGAAGIPIPNIAKNICGECMCPIEWRTRKAHHECPLGKWGSQE